MRIAGSIITAICGIVVIVAICFLHWSDGGATGWDYIDASMAADGFLNVFLVFLGGILMAVFAIPAFIVSLASKGGRAAVLTLGILAIVGALLAIGGSAWFIIDYVFDPFWSQMGLSALDAFKDLSYGLWIAIAGAIVGFIFAILTTAFSKGRQS